MKIKTHHQKNDRGEQFHKCKGRVWIEGKDGTFLGYGRVVLLERIAQYGSISRAARSMKMSYKHAWDLVDSMNRQAEAALVSKTTGGKGGGGAVLTEAGKESVQYFWQLYERLTFFLNEETARLPTNLRMKS